MKSRFRFRFRRVGTPFKSRGAGCGRATTRAHADFHGAPPMRNRPPALAHVEAGVRAQATRSAVGLIKDRARAYAKRPTTLESVFPGLSSAAPETIIGVLRHLIVAERNTPRRWFGS